MVIVFVKDVTETLQLGDRMKKQNKGILYGMIYFAVVVCVVCLLVIVFAFSIVADNLLLMMISSIPIFLITLFQSMVIRDMVIYKKYGVEP